MCPVLFAAHYNPGSDDRYWNDDKTVLLMLTAVFQPMMSLFILYYLDTRVSPEAPIPSWMVLFGITYTWSGMEIWGHSPWFLSDVNSGGNESIWSARRWKASHLHNTAFRGRFMERCAFLGSLNRIQGHCKYVLEQLRVWEGYDRACELLMA